MPIPSLRLVLCPDLLFPHRREPGKLVRRRDVAVGPREGMAMWCCGIRRNGSCFLCVCCFCDLDALRPAAKGPPRADPSLLGGLVRSRGSVLIALPHVLRVPLSEEEEDADNHKTKTQPNKTPFFFFFSPVSQDNRNNNTTKTAEAPASFVLGPWGRLLSFDKAAKKKKREEKRED